MCKIYLCIYVFEDDKYNEITKKIFTYNKRLKKQDGRQFWQKKSLSV